MRTSDSPGALIRDVRARCGLSQRELAERAGTSQSVVGRIEAGLSSPSVGTLERLLDAAGYELRMEISPKPVRDPVVEAYKPGVDQTLLIENLGKTPRERMETLMAMQQFADEVRRAGVEARRRVAESGPGYRNDGEAE